MLFNTLFYLLWLFWFLLLWFIFFVIFVINFGFSYVWLVIVGVAYWVLFFSMDGYDSESNNNDDDVRIFLNVSLLLFLSVSLCCFYFFWSFNHFRCAWRYVCCCFSYPRYFYCCRRCCHLLDNFNRDVNRRWR